MRWLAGSTRSRTRAATLSLSSSTSRSTISRCSTSRSRGPWANTRRITRRHGSAKIASFDAFVFVTPEYTHAKSGALKNAIDYLYKEWTNKAAGFVGYGGAGGTRAVENLRLVMGELMIADVRAQVALSLFTDFENFSVFKPAPHHEKSVHDVLDHGYRAREIDD